MTSRHQAQPRKRRSLLWLFLFLAVLFGLYSAGWFYAADRIRDESRQAIADLSRKGIRSDCARLRVEGYPLRLAVLCNGIAYQDDAKGIAATTGALEASTSIFRPLVADVNLRGPVRTLAPGLAPLWLDWDSLDVSTKLFWPLPRQVTLTANGVSGQTDPEDDEPTQLFNLSDIALDFWPEGEDILYRGSFAELDITADALQGRNVPSLDGFGEARLKNGVAIVQSKPKSLRGQALDITNLELSSGEARISVSGPVSVDDAGLVDADLMIRLTNPQAVAEVLATAVPEEAKKIRQGFSALAMMGKQPAMPLKIVKGNAMMGFIPLGAIKPLP